MNNSPNAVGPDYGKDPPDTSKPAPPPPPPTPAPAPAPTPAPSTMKAVLVKGLTVLAVLWALLAGGCGGTMIMEVKPGAGQAAKKKAHDAFTHQPKALCVATCRLNAMYAGCGGYSGRTIGVDTEASTGIMCADATADAVMEAAGYCTMGDVITLDCGEVLTEEDLNKLDGIDGITLMSLDNQVQSKQPKLGTLSNEAVAAAVAAVEAAFPGKKIIIKQ